MLHFMRNVREVSSLWPQLLDVFQRALQPQVRLMRANAQTIEHENFQTLQAVDGCGRNLTEVGRVSKIVEPVSNYRQPPVNYFKRGYLKIVTDTKGRATDHRMRHYLREAAPKMCGLKDILKDAADVFPRAFVGIQAQGAITKVQRANVIQAENMIRVTMRHQHRIEVPQSNLQGLLSKIARGINNDCLTGVFDQY